MSILHPQPEMHTEIVYSKSKYEELTLTACNATLDMYIMFEAGSGDAASKMVMESLALSVTHGIEAMRQMACRIHESEE